MNEAHVREGGDITAADMIFPEEDPSEIVEFFKDSTVFLTGATGFIGKLVLEKLLRTCNSLNKVYVLIRPKKGKDIRTRFEEIFSGPQMDPLKRIYPDFIQKVEIIDGDCSEANNGILPHDVQKLINEVNVVIHCAATVRFDEKLRKAVNINVRCVMDMIHLAKQMRELKSFLYVSTAYSYCPLDTIKEKFYNSPITGDKLVSLTNSLDDDKLDQITPIILDKWPNTYVYTKAIAENVVQIEGNNLPIGVIRPSIITGTIKEPVAGFIDNFYGTTGIFLGAALGVLRSLHGNKKNQSDMIPADFVVNAALAATWDIAKTRTINDNNENQENFEKEAPIYNCVSAQSPLTWHDFMSYAEKHSPLAATEHSIWFYYFALRSNKLHHLIASFFLHWVPAYAIDLILFCMGKKTQMVATYKKVEKFADVISYFTMREWNFTNDNFRNLWNRLGTADKRLFEFSMSNFDWEVYFGTYIRGARVYVLKDPLDTIPKGQAKYYKLKYMHYTLMYTIYGLMCFAMYKILSFVWPLMF